MQKGFRVLSISTTKASLDPPTSTDTAPSHTWNAESAKAEPHQSADLNYAKGDGPSPAGALIELPHSPTGVTESELRGRSSSNSSAPTSAETSLPTTKNEVSSPTFSANRSSPGPQRRRLLSATKSESSSACSEDSESTPASSPATSNLPTLESASTTSSSTSEV